MTVDSFYSLSLVLLLKHSKILEVMVRAQCLWDVAIKMNSSIDSTNILVANLKPLIRALRSR